MKNISKSILFSAVTTLLFSTFALSAEVKKVDVSYQRVSISAKNVNGVKVVLKKEYMRRNCNHMNIEASAKFLEGNQEHESGTPINYYSTYFVNVDSFSTVMGCQNLDNPVKEIAETSSLDFPSYSNQNIDKGLKIDLILPRDLEVSVIEY